MSNPPAPAKFRVSRLGLFAALLLGGCVGGGSAPSPQQGETGAGPPAAVASAAIRQCHGLLAEAGAGFSPIEDLLAGNSCASTNAVSVLSLASDHGRMGVSNLDRVYCPLADSFAGWARYGVNRAAEQILGSPVTKIETFGSYSCRNVAGTGRRSAHAGGRAIDISGFVLANGRRVTVLEGWNGSAAEQQFLRVIHASACKRFGTVLSPDYNAAHRNHFHVEPGAGGFCR